MMRQPLLRFGGFMQGREVVLKGDRASTQAPLQASDLRQPMAHAARQRRDGFRQLQQLLHRRQRHNSLEGLLFWFSSSHMTPCGANE